MPSPRKTRSVAILALPGVQLLDVSGPLDVFAEANAQAGSRQKAAAPYRLQVIASRPGPILSSSGIRLLADATISESSSSEKFDTLLVAGCPNAAEISPGARVLEWLRQIAPHLRRYGSVCSGAFVLAAAGLLDGRRVTTHWAVAERLAQAFPQVSVDPDAIHVRDGRLRTAAGVTAGLDLALALVEEDLGRRFALELARLLVMFLKRPGGQSQFSSELISQLASPDRLEDLLEWIRDHLDRPLTIEDLARRSKMSARNFQRVFTRQCGMPPAKFIERLRVERARLIIEDTGLSMTEIARKSGFDSEQRMRRAFRRVLGINPADHADRVRPPTADEAVSTSR